MAYLHGIYPDEATTSISSVASTVGVHVVFGTAPINLASDPYAVTNVPKLVESYEEAVNLFGYSSDFSSYTLCQAMYAYFRHYGIAPVVFINVLDPAKHVSDVSESVSVVNGECTLTSLGVLADTLSVKSGEENLTADVDYIATFNSEGAINITILKDGIDNVTVSGKKLEPSKVTDEDIIGGYNEATGVKTGIELIRDIYPRFGRYALITVAPGFSKSNAVAAALQLKTEKINGMFDCDTIIDIDVSKAKSYVDVEKAKKDMALVSAHAIACWPKVQIDDMVFDYSVVLAAYIAYSDHENDDIPSISPSNKELGITGVCDDNGAEIVIDNLQGNTLNAVGVVTAINMNGWRSWGNNTTIYPKSTDPKDRWIDCRRFFTWMKNRFCVTYFSKIDSPADFRLIESIVEQENQYCSGLVAGGHCLSAFIELDSSKDLTQSLLDGHVAFIQHIAKSAPAEHISNTFVFDIDALSSALEGGE
jgi:hypothetical protein